MLRERLIKQFRLCASNVAVSTAAGPVTYEELGRRAARTALAIRDGLAGGGSGRNVGLLFDHDADSITAIAGAVLSGYTYVPLHAEAPIERTAAQVAHAHVGLIVSVSRLAPAVEALRAGQLMAPVYLDTLQGGGPGPEAVPCPDKENSLYLLHTSGSTGKPKAVMQSAANVERIIDRYRERLGLSATDGILMFAHLAFDAAVVDVFSTLLSGAALHPYALPRQSRETLLPNYLNSGQVTVWHSVPSLFRHFTEALSGGPVFPGIRLLLLGGEAVRRQDVQACRKFFPNATFGSIYGQTESSVNSLWLVAPKIDDYRISTGEPLDGTQLFVTDDNGSTVEPLGVGQIVVASTAIAPGYWNDPKLTRAVFSNDPELGPLYWTGDMGRLLPDGRIEFTGRRDHQVKIRGMRVELGEIECRLCDHPAVSEAIVTCRERADGLPLLACYWQARDGGRLEASEIRAHLARHLPAPMIPSRYLQVDAWPRNANGKIDRKALPDIPDGPAVLSVATATEREEQVLALWKRVLQSDSVGLQTNFFDAGGNSLKLFKLQALYAESSGTVIPLARFFEYPTVREFATFLECGPRREQAPPAGRPANRLADRKKRLERE